MNRFTPVRLGSRTTRRCRAERSRGQSLVEFALVLPLLALILLMAVDFGRVFLGWVELNNISRIGANFAALNPQGWEGAGIATLQTKYKSLIIADARATNCKLPDPANPSAPTFPDANPNTYSLGSRAVVALTCKFHVFTPLIGSIVGDSNGDVSVSVSSTFAIRGGAVAGIPVGTVAPTATPAVTPAPTPPPTVNFYGTPTSLNSSGGGAPGSPGGNQIVGIPPLVVAFTNTTTGPQVSCLWTYGDGATLASCGGASHTYATPGTYSVSLTVDGTSAAKSSYILVGCQVPDFHGVKKNNAASTWTSAGFTVAPTTQSGTGNYSINFQSIASGTLNPAGGCSGATITVGP